MGKKRSRKKKKLSIISSKEKGKIVEQITASLHEWPNVKVERNASLPVLGDSMRKREIDVLLTTEVTGYPVRIAIECKNTKMPIDSPQIDSFIGKLIDVGIPPQLGIYVSASGYTSGTRGGAIERARKEGIRPLVLSGLTKEGLSKSVEEAFQSVVYLLAVIDTISFIRDLPDFSPADMEIFHNEEGKICGSVSNLIWQYLAILD